MITVKNKLSVFQGILLLSMLVYFSKETSAFTLNQERVKSQVAVENIVKKNYPNCNLTQLKDLYEDLQVYLRTEYPDSHPGFVKSDFNGDGITDYALLIRCKKANRISQRFVVLLGKKWDLFHWINIHEWDDELSLKNRFLHIVPPGEVKEWDTTSTIRLRLPGIELTLFESASRVYYWDGCKFNFVQTSD